jgi:hypothetical protein
VSEPFTVEIARTKADLERLAPVWGALPWEREEAELPYFLAGVEVKPDVEAPFAVVVLRGGEPVAGLAARVERRQLHTFFGPRLVYAPRLRILQIVDGGVVVAGPAAIPTLVAELRRALAAGVADVCKVPPLPLDSALLRALAGAGGPLGQQSLVAPWPRRRLVLPASFADFLASRSGKVRFGIRYDARKLHAALGEELAVEVLATPADHERIMRELDSVAARTYLRTLGVGFADTPEQRRLVEVGLEHGWVRAYVLSRGGTPIAFWLCSVYRGTILLKTTGYDPEYAPLRVGIYLLMRVIELACADPSLELLDFGPGEADYKRMFSSESRDERNLVLYGPTARARRVAVLRTAILAAGVAAHAAADRSGLSARLRARRKRAAR